MIRDIGVILLLLLFWPSLAETTVRAIRERTITLMPRFVCERDRKYLKEKCTYPRDSDPVNYWAGVGGGVFLLLSLPVLACFAVIDLWHRL